MIPTPEQIATMKARGWTYDAEWQTFWAGAPPGSEESALRLCVRSFLERGWVVFVGVPGRDYSRGQTYPDPLLAADEAEGWLRAELARLTFPWLAVAPRASRADLAELTHDELVEELRACDVALSRSVYTELSRSERIRRLFVGLDAAEQIYRDHKAMFEAYQSVKASLAEARDLARRFKAADTVMPWEFPAWLDEDAEDEVSDDAGSVP